jgi:hypothetical protein
MRHAVVISSQSRIRLSLGLVCWVPTKVYPTKRFGLDLPAGLQCSFIQSIPAKDLFLASWLLQRVVASLTLRAGPTRAADVRPALRLAGAELQMLVLSFAGLGVGKTMAPIPARVGSENSDWLGVHVMSSTMSLPATALPPGPRAPAGSGPSGSWSGSSGRTSGSPSGAATGSASGCRSRFTR